MEDFQSCSRKCKDIEYEREKFMDERTENYELRAELEATKRMLVASHDSTAAAIAELLLAEKQRDLLAEELGKHGYLPPCEGTRGDCSEYCDNYCEDMEESACWKHWSEANAREVENGI